MKVRNNRVLAENDEVKSDFCKFFDDIYSHATDFSVMGLYEEIRRDFSAVWKEEIF